MRGRRIFEKVFLFCDDGLHEAKYISPPREEGIKGRS